MTRPTPHHDAQMKLAATSSTPVYRMKFRRQRLNYAQPFVMFHRTAAGLMTTGPVSVSSAMDPTYTVSYRKVRAEDVYLLVDESAAVVTNAATARALSAYARAICEDGPDGAHRIAFGVEKAHAMRSLAFGLLVDLSHMAQSFYVIPEGAGDPLAFIMNRTGLRNDANGHLAFVRSTCLGDGFDVDASPLRTRQNKLLGEASSIVQRAGIMSVASLGFSGEVSNSSHFIVGGVTSSVHSFLVATDPIARHFAAEAGEITRLEPISGQGARVRLAGTFRLGFDKNALLFTEDDDLGLARLSDPQVEGDFMTASMTSGAGMYAKDNAKVVTRVSMGGGWIVAEPFSGAMIPRSGTLRRWGSDPANSGKEAPAIPKRTIPMHIALAGAPRE